MNAASRSINQENLNTLLQKRMPRATAVTYNDKKIQHLTPTLTVHQEFNMRLLIALRTRISITALLVTLTGCSVLQPDAHLAAFSTQMTGMNQVPPVATVATGRVDAVLDKNTRLFRWKMSYRGLNSPVTAAHFHGPAAIGSPARIALPFKAPVKSPYEGQATLTEAQAQDLLRGHWYANIHSEAHPGGEIRGQMILRE